MQFYTMMESFVSSFAQRLRLKLIFLLTTAGLLFGAAVHAQVWDYSENFDSLNPGDLDGQSSWSYYAGSHVANVTSTYSPDGGTQHVVAKGASSETNAYQLDFPDKTYGEFYVSIKSEDPTDAYVYFKADHGETNAFLVGLNSTLSGYLAYTGEGDGSWTNVQSASADTYYKIGIRFNSESTPHYGLNQYQAAMNINGGSWTMFNYYSNQSTIDNLRVFLYSDSGTKRVAFDEIESTATSTSTSSVFTVSEGGTGASSFVTNGVLYGNGTSTIQATAAGSAYQILRIPGGGGAPSFGAIDLSQSVAVTGILALEHGGTGSSSFATGSIPFINAGVFGQDQANFYWDATNQRLGLGTNTPESRLDVSGTATVQHVRGKGTTPSVSTDTCAGTGGSASIEGTDVAGMVTLNTGTATPANSKCFTVTYAAAYDSAPYVVFSPVNREAARLTGTKVVFASSTESAFEFAVDGTSLSNDVTYIWNYHVIE